MKRCSMFNQPPMSISSECISQLHAQIQVISPYSDRFCTQLSPRPSLSSDRAPCSYHSSREIQNSSLFFMMSARTAPPRFSLLCPLSASRLRMKLRFARTSTDGRTPPPPSFAHRPQMTCCGVAMLVSFSVCAAAAAAVLPLLLVLGDMCTQHTRTGVQRTGHGGPEHLLLCTETRHVTATATVTVTGQSHSTPEGQMITGSWFGWVGWG